MEVGFMEVSLYIAHNRRYQMTERSLYALTDRQKT